MLFVALALLPDIRLDVTVTVTLRYDLVAGSIRVWPLPRTTFCLFTVTIAGYYIAIQCSGTVDGPGWIWCVVGLAVTVTLLLRMTGRWTLTTLPFPLLFRCDLLLPLVTLHTLIASLRYVTLQLAIYDFPVTDVTFVTVTGRCSLVTPRYGYGCCWDTWPRFTGCPEHSRLLRLPVLR